MLLLTERLELSPLTQADKLWIVEMHQDSLWKQFIGNRGVASVEDAADYIDRVNAQLNEWGYGVLAIRNKKTNTPYGVCGLINRFIFSCPDLGFALLPIARKQGIALEAAKAVMDWVEMEEEMHFITASTHPENTRSQHLLQKLGFEKRGPYFIDKSTPVQTLFLRNSEFAGR
ncbi:GNAT family N-acetyltransferase [Alteromonas stellipolaris]|uniref:GNAT family N-acetyltransferase n=1 Tax=Alteromonas stellipolaris TaxID=233316 RepID=UPI0026E32B05|nr:GNAT family N-acetyltransferase [Alteromonas stellipolaris]MDO6537266.1 GNAT family N-acetyltransferase [Alteromonas stellipolaris]